jgi:hypothetical protein
MEWIFGALGAGSLAVLGLQLLEYVLDSRCALIARRDCYPFTGDAPPSDVLPAVELTEWYEQAA